MYRKADYIAKLNTGDVLAAGSRRGLNNNIRAYFSVVRGAYYALVLLDNRPVAFVWKTPRGMVSVPVVE